MVPPVPLVVGLRMTRICRLVVFVFAVVCAANAYALTGRVVRLRGVELESQLTLPWRISVETAMQVARGRYQLIDLSAGMTALKQLEIRGLVRNLTDETYFASQDVRAVLAPGRAASLTAVVRV